MNLPVMPPFMQKCYMHNQFDYIHQTGELSNIKVNTPLRTHPISLPNVRMSLHNRELWQQFHMETTEMIITKVGRRMFPPLQLDIDGLQENFNYCILVEMEPASPHRHKYCGSTQFDENGNKINSRGWTKAGQAESQPDIEQRIYLHPESPARGSHWMKHTINFHKLKVTNANEHGSNVLLTSMHKYIPRIWIFQSDHSGNFNELYSQPHSSFTFKETEFIAVTAYQNEKITKLKINNNPFAKGFRETGHSRCKRKQEEDTTCHSNQMNDEDSNSSFDSGPMPSMLLRTDVLHNVTNTGTVPSQNLTYRAEDNHLNARPSTPSPCYKFYRPWSMDTPRSSLEVNLPPPSLPLPSFTLPNLSLYNVPFSAPGILPHSFALPTSSQYQHFGYSNIRDWHGAFYYMPWYSPF